MPNNMMAPDEGSQPAGGGESMGPGKEQAYDGAGGANPVIKALQDVGAFISQQQKSGNPKASEMLQKFQELIQAMQPGGAPEQEQPQEQQQGPAEAGPKQMSPGGINRGGVSRPLSGQGMNPNKGSVPVL